jgi:hypothetical protein
MIKPTIFGATLVMSAAPPSCSSRGCPRMRKHVRRRATCSPTASSLPRRCALKPAAR